MPYEILSNAVDDVTSRHEKMSALERPTRRSSAASQGRRRFTFVRLLSPFKLFESGLIECARATTTSEPLKAEQKADTQGLDLH